MPLKFPTKFKIAPVAIYVWGKGQVWGGRTVGNIGRDSVFSLVYELE